MRSNSYQGLSSSLLRNTQRGNEMNAIDNHYEMRTNADACNRICWSNFFLADMEWLTDLSGLITSDATLATASILAAYCDLIEDGQLVLEAEAAQKMVRNSVVAQCCFLVKRWQRNPGWCGRQFANISADLQLPFLICVVLGWQEEKARSMLQNSGLVLDVLLTEAGDFFDGGHYKQIPLQAQSANHVAC
jgi:hypothetical protein